MPPPMAIRPMEPDWLPPPPPPPPPRPWHWALAGGETAASRAVEISPRASQRSARIRNRPTVFIAVTPFMWVRTKNRNGPQCVNEWLAATRRSPLLLNPEVSQTDRRIPADF